MKELIGHKITNIEMEGDEIIVFTIEDGKHIAYKSYGDCCSSTWISHISGIKFLLGQTVLAVTIRQMFTDEEQEKAEAEGHYDVLELYGYDIKTKKGECFLEFRNDSNGYYGGTLDLMDESDSFESLKEINKDF